MGPILVIGHRNPDNDSICSAVALAHLKNVTDKDEVYVPVRLGPLPPETAWVLERFGVEPPELVDHVRMRVRDVVGDDVVAVPPDANLLEVGRLMRERQIRALPIVEDGVVRGLIDTRTLADRFVEETEMIGFGQLPVKAGQLAEVLEGRLLAGDEGMTLSGGVLIGAMEPETMVGYISPGDTLIIGDRKRSQPMALDAGAACLVVTGGSIPADEVLNSARSKGAAIISTAMDTYAAARRINLSHAVERFMDRSVPIVQPDTLLADAAEELLASPQRVALVVDSTGRLKGIVTRTDVAQGARRRVVLVDHSEVAQSADGVGEADVVEIVDHHRVGDIQTSRPIPYFGQPVGSTATIVAGQYRDAGVEPPKAMAGLMLSAVLSDTLLLKSPTVTDADREVVRWLADACGEDADAFGMEMFHARSAGQRLSADEIVRTDMKVYRAGDRLVAVSQIETVDAEQHREHLAELLPVMDRLREDGRFALVLLMITDVVREGSEILAVGDLRFATRALGVDLGGGSAWFPGVLSRKGQVAARLMGTAVE